MTDTPPADTPPADTPPADTPPAAAPEWMNGLPDELKGDKTLSRYADVNALAAAHIEAHKVAKSKVIVPGEGADEATLGAFFDAIGRPASADDYDVPMPELPVDATDEQRAAVAESIKPFKTLAHQIGLTPAQVKALGQFDMQRGQDAIAKGQEELDALRTQLGKDYDTKLAAAQQVGRQIFGDDDEVALIFNEMDGKLGSGRFVKGMMRLAEIAGEAKLIDTDKVEGFGDVKDASAKIDALQADEAWRKRFNDNDPQTVAEYNRLLDLAKRQALRGSTATRTA